MEKLMLDDDICGTMPFDMMQFLVRGQEPAVSQHASTQPQQEPLVYDVRWRPHLYETKFGYDLYVRGMLAHN